MFAAVDQMCAFQNFTTVVAMETRIALARVAVHTVTFPGAIVDGCAVRNSAASTSPPSVALTLIDGHTATVSYTWEKHVKENSSLRCRGEGLSVVD